MKLNKNMTLITLLITIFHLSYMDLKSRYRRSFLGPWWIVIGTGLGSAGLGYMWSIMFKLNPSEMIPAITIGLISWIFLSSAVIDSCNTFIASGDLLKNYNLPFYFYPMFQVSKKINDFFHSLLIVIIMFFIYPNIFNINLLLFFPGIIIVCINIFLISSFLGLLTARFRDIQQLVTSIMPLIFFISPVLFKIEQLENLKFLMWINPFTYFITVIKNPLLGTIPDPYIYYVNFGFMIIGLAFLFLLKKQFKKITFWV